MKIRAYFGGHDSSSFALIDGFAVDQDSTEAISTCKISLLQKYGEARYDHALYSQASFMYEWQIQEWQEVIVQDADTSQLLFGGYVLKIDRQIEGPHVRIEVSASDWGILFERALITQTWPDGTVDSTVFSDALAQVPLLKAGTIVPQVTNIGELEAKDQRIRDLFDNVCDLTGGEWNVSYDGKLNYYRSGSIVAPFALSDEPDGSASVGYSLDGFDNDFSDAANRILALGALTDDGVELRSIAENSASELKYGILSVTLVDRNISDQTTLDLWAQSEVATRSIPKPTVTATVFTPGLARGMTVSLQALKYGLFADLILRKLSIEIIAPDPARAGGPGHKLKYSATLGYRPADAIYALRRMQRRPIERTKSPPATVAPGSIDGADLADGLELIQVVNALPALPDPQYSDTAVVFWKSAPRGPQLYRRTGNTWTAYVDVEAIQGQIQTTQLAPGSVTSTVLADGAVITAKIPAGAITGPQLAAGSVTANAVAANAIYAQALQANSVTAVALAANSVTAGKIAALAVEAGKIAADAVTAGTIAAAAVRAGNLAAGAVTAGTIATRAIRAGDAVFDTAAIQDADIANLNGNKITAHSIDVSKLSAIEIAVGYGGDKPGRVGVYNAQKLVALLGDLGGAGLTAGAYYGIWAIQAAFGGSGYNDAPIYTDTAGSLFLRQANLTITASDGSKIRTGPTTFDSSYGTIMLAVEKPNDSAVQLISRGLVIRNSSNSQTIGAFVRSPTNLNATELTLYNNGAFVIHLNAIDSTIRADGGFKVSANSVINSSGQFTGPGVNMPSGDISLGSGNVTIGGGFYGYQCVVTSGFTAGGSAGFTGSVPAGRGLTVKGGIITGYV